MPTYLWLQTKYAYLPNYPCLPTTANQKCLPTDLHIPSYRTTYAFVLNYIWLSTNLHMPSYRTTYAYLPTYLCLPTDIHMPTNRPTYAFIPTTYANIPTYICLRTELHMPTYRPTYFYKIALFKWVSKRTFNKSCRRPKYLVANFFNFWVFLIAYFTTTNRTLRKSARMIFWYPLKGLAKTTGPLSRVYSCCTATIA